MTDPNDDSPPKKTATQILSELVARKAEAGKAKAGAGRVGVGKSERAAAARSSAKSKPALRK